MLLLVTTQFVNPLSPQLTLLTSRPDMHKRVYGVSFKKRAPQAIKAIKEFAKLHMVPSAPSNNEYWQCVGNDRCPCGSSVEQESLGEGDQDRPSSHAFTVVEKEKRWGRCKREIVYVCGGCQCEGSQGITDRCCWVLISYTRVCCMSM